MTTPAPESILDGMGVARRVIDCKVIVGVGSHREGIRLSLYATLSTPWMNEDGYALLTPTEARHVAKLLIKAADKGESHD